MSLDESVIVRRIYRFASSDTVGEMFLMSVFLYLRICQEYCFSFFRQFNVLAHWCDPTGTHF